MQNLSNDMVSRIEYDEKEQECIAKEEQVQVTIVHRTRLCQMESSRFCKRKSVV